MQLFCAVSPIVIKRLPKNKRNMANLKFNFTFKDSVFCLCCTVEGTTTRHYKVVSGSYKLSNPNFDKWDKREQRFIDPTTDAIYNNERLEAMKKHYQSLYETLSASMEVIDGKMLFSLEPQVPRIVAEKQMTFGDYLHQIILKGKQDCTKKPSKNYQKYITLQHKLEREKVIINKPLREICNSDFIAFGRFILDSLTIKEGRNNYVNLMKLFKAVHTRAYNMELNNHVLRYPYMNEAPTRKSRERVVLSPKQYRKFCNLDLSVIPQSGVNPSFYKELYRDFCIFLYEMKMRPCDVIRLHSNDIHNDHITYVAEKKKNYLDERKRTTCVKLTDVAKHIICRYKGKSTKGYIFPFAMNNYDWNFDDATSWNKWHNRKQKTLQDINEYLRKFESILHVKGMTLYTFRHSTFTHSLNAKGCNMLKIAREGATSIDMLENHYYHLQDDKK